MERDAELRTDPSDNPRAAVPLTAQRIPVEVSEPMRPASVTVVGNGSQRSGRGDPVLGRTTVRQSFARSRSLWIKKRARRRVVLTSSRRCPQWSGSPALGVLVAGGLIELTGADNGGIEDLIDAVAHAIGRPVMVSRRTDRDVWRLEVAR